MTRKNEVPSAWDDDWESAADRIEESSRTAPQEETPFAKTSKAERLAKHAESNKKIWESAETPTLDPNAFPYLSVHDSIPLKTEFKPALKVLSRKPTPKAVEIIDPVTGLSNIRLEDDGEEDDTAERAQKLSPEQLRERAKRDREEKQKRYDEARMRILGTGHETATATALATATTVVGQGNESATTSPIGDETRAKGRGRGRGGVSTRGDSQRPGSGSGFRELFDPNYSPKTGSVTIQKRNGESCVSPRPDSRRSTPRIEDQIVRTPKGPDGSGRGGGGFVYRGGNKTR